MPSNINYHLTFSTESKSYDVNLVATDSSSETSVVIEGRSYSVSGDDSSWLKEKISKSKTSDFHDIREFKAALLEGDESTQKVQEVGIEVLIKTLTPKQKLRRAVKHMAKVGRGLTKMRKGGVRGRTIQEAYYLEVTGKLGESNPLAHEKDWLWKERDKGIRLSFPEWDQKTTEEWKISGSDLGFVEWVSQERWKDSGTSDSYEDWGLKRIQKRFKDSDPFEKFKKGDTECRENIRKKELPHLSFKDFNKLFNSKMAEGTTLSFVNWEKYQQWKALKSPGDFADWAMKQDYQREVKSGSKLTFGEWKDKQEEKLRTRWEGSGFKAKGISFEKWRVIQDDSLLVKSRDFIRLNNDQRKLFHLSFSKGVIQRNGIPYNTAHDKTLHSGDGFAIFVGSPDGDIYAGSHIGNVFHHSSFLADGAVPFAGEIKTNEKGEVTYISSKSGHYKPTDEESRLMLLMFKDFGVDLSKVKFSCYARDGKTLELGNAEEYLQHVASVQTERKKLRLEMSSGKLKKGQGQIVGAEQLVVFNERGYLYSGPNISDCFILEGDKSRLISPSKKVKTPIPEEKQTIQKIKQTMAKKDRLSKDSQQLRTLIKKTTKKNRARREGRQILLEQKEQAIKKLEKKYSELQATLKNIRELGKDVVKGGGKMTIEPDGRISRIDTKLAKKRLTDEEIRFTLKQMKNKGVDLNKVTLVTYDSKGKSTEHKNALKHLEKLLSKK